MSHSQLIHSSILKSLKNQAKTISQNIWLFYVLIWLSFKSR